MKDFAKQKFLTETKEDLVMERLAYVASKKTSRPSKQTGRHVVQAKEEKEKAELEFTILTNIRAYRNKYGSVVLKDFLSDQCNLPF